ncbi:MAG: hypothetical protein V1646_03945 [bacterium]
MIFSKKNIFKSRLAVILLFAACSLNLNATTAEDIESLTAFLRIPAAIGVNTLGKQRGVAPKIILIASDCIRLSNEMLSIVNKRERYDFHTYDYCWTAYDVGQLMLHVRSFLSNKIEQSGSNEIRKLEKMTQ